MVRSSAKFLRSHVGCLLIAAAVLGSCSATGTSNDTNNSLVDSFASQSDVEGSVQVTQLRGGIADGGDSSAPARPDVGGIGAAGSEVAEEDLLWLWLGLCGAVTVSVKDILWKSHMSGLPSGSLVFVIRIAMAICGQSLLLFLGEDTPFDIHFSLSQELATALAISGLLNALAAMCYAQALKTGDVSKTVPLIALTPAFLCITTPAILSDGFPAPLGIFGVNVIVLGAYMLNLKEGKNSLFGPLVSMYHQPGPKYAISVALLWSISSVYDKIGMKYVSPLVWGLLITVVIVCCMMPFLLWRQRHEFKSLNGHMIKVFFFALTELLILGLQMAAVKHGKPAYVSAIKRLSTCFSMALSAWTLGERVSSKQISGAVMMMLGAGLLALSEDRKSVV